MKLENSKLLEEREKILNEHGIKKSFLEDVYKCSICKDTGYVHDKECACLKKRIIEKSYDMSNIKSNLEFENFKNFDMSFYSDEIVEKMGISPKKQMEFILSKVKNFIENFDKHFGNLLLYGKTGLGKTFICNCIAKEILDKGKSVLYLTSTQLFKMLEKSTFGKDNDDFDEILKLIFDADLLIIDDLGTEFQTFFTETEFFNIINLRILKKKSVIISTNLSIKDIRDNYSDRIFSRFFGSYDFLEFLGEDIRILKLTRG